MSPPASESAVKQSKARACRMPDGQASPSMRRHIRSLDSRVEEIAGRRREEAGRGSLGDRISPPDHDDYRIGMNIIRVTGE